LEIYYCFACNRNQYKYTTTIDGVLTITICQSFAKKIWDQSDLSMSTDTFDNCGIMVNGAVSINPYKLPSQQFTSFDNFVSNLKPPFFSTYKIVVDPTDNSDNCFATSTLSWLKLIGIFVISLLLLLQ